MHARLKKSLKRRPEPVAFESKITEKGGMKVIEFLFFSSSSSSDQTLMRISTTEKMERYNFLLLCG